MSLEERNELRVSDDERREAVRRLQVELSVGRLDLAEFEERCDEAGRARTRSDLAKVLRDLPALPPGRVVTAATVSTAVAVNGACVSWWTIAGAETAFWPGWVLASTGAVVAVGVLRDWFRLRPT